MLVGVEGLSGVCVFTLVFKPISKTQEPRSLPLWTRTSHAQQWTTPRSMSITVHLE